MLKIRHNYVAVQIQGQFMDKYKSLLIPIKWHPQAHTVIHGIVTTAPEKLLFFKDEILAIKNEFGSTQHCPVDRREEIQWLTSKSMFYDVPVEVQQGDFILFHYNVYAQAQKEGRFFQKNGETTILIPYDMCYVVIREEKIIPLNGIVLLEPVVNKQSEVIITEDKEDKLLGKIAHIGCKVNGYLDYMEETDDDFFEVGDLVAFRKRSVVDFEYPLHRMLDKKYWRLWRRDLLGKVESVDSTKEQFNDIANGRN